VTVTVKKIVHWDPSDTKLMSLAHQSLWRLSRKHHLVYDPLLENLNQISGMAQIGYHLPQLLFVHWKDKLWMEVLLLLKLLSQELHSRHLPPQFLRGYVIHWMYQNIRSISIWNGFNFSAPSYSYVRPACHMLLSHIHSMLITPLTLGSFAWLIF